MDDYLPILILLILGFLFAALSFVASALLAPRKRPDRGQDRPLRVRHRARPSSRPTRFPVRFYLIAMIFIIFDIEIVFLYPWAVIFRQLGSFGLVEVVVFAAVVFISFLFLVSNGALSWGPAKRLVGAMPSRTSESTIARITAGPGGPGRSTHAVGTRSPTDPSAPVTTDPDAPTTGEPATAPTGPGRAA